MKRERGLTEGGRSIGCEGHPNNAEREIIPQRQRTFVVQLLGGGITVSPVILDEGSSTSNSCLGGIGKSIPSTLLISLDP